MLPTLTFTTNLALIVGISLVFNTARHHVLSETVLTTSEASKKKHAIGEFTESCLDTGKLDEVLEKRKLLAKAAR